MINTVVPSQAAKFVVKISAPHTFATGTEAKAPIALSVHRVSRGRISYEATRSARIRTSGL